MMAVPHEPLPQRGGGHTSHHDNMKLLPLALLIYDTPGGNLLYDWSLDARGVRLADSERGHESLMWSVEMNAEQAFRIYDRLETPHVLLTNGVDAWEGRLEDKRATERGLELTAMGYWRAVSDYGPYNALWSDTSVSRWVMPTSDEIATSANHQYELDTNNRLFLSPRSGEAIANGNGGYIGYTIPDESLRGMVVVQFAYRVFGTNFTAALQSRTSAWASPSSLWSLAGSVSAQTGAKFITFTAAEALTFEHLATIDVNITDTGSKLLKITKLRVATSTTNIVNTTIGSNITAGVRVVTPASMAGIYVGQELVITGSLSVGEIVTVTAVTSTTFTATFSISHTATVAVKGIVVYASEIAEDVVAKIYAMNPGQISDSIAEIETTSRDLEIELYEEKTAQDILGYLADEGDDTRQEVGVWNDQRLYFRDRGSNARTWYTDAVEIELASTLNTLTNQVYAVYRREGGGVQRTAEAADDLSQAGYGIIRRGFTVASTTSQTQAEAQRTAYLAGRSTITPRSRVVTEGLFNAAGIEYPPWMLKAGDVMVIRNLPPTLGESVDKIRRFRVARKTYDVERDEMHPTPELELPGLDVMIARPQIKQARDNVKADWALAPIAAADTV